MNRPITSTQLKRSETEYARQRYFYLVSITMFCLFPIHRKQFDSNPRFRGENIINLDLDMPEKTTQVFIADSKFGTCVIVFYVIGL